MVILAIDLAKAKSLFCWYQTSDNTHELRTIVSSPAAFHDALLQRQVDRVVIEVCDMAGWIQDLCQTLSIPLQIANANTQGWRWRNVKVKTDKTDVLKLASLSQSNQLPLVSLPDRFTRQWRSLILYRQKLIDRRTRIKNRIHALLVSQAKAMEGGSSAWTAQSLAKLSGLAKPHERSIRLLPRERAVVHLNGIADDTHLCEVSFAPERVRPRRELRGALRLRRPGRLHRRHLHRRLDDLRGHRRGDLHPCHRFAGWSVRP